MNFKDFIKPTVIKIILTLILLLIPFYRYIICGDIVVPIRCSVTWYSAFSFFLESLRSSRLDIGAPVLLLSIIISYLISSLIIYIFNKIKKSS